MLQDTLLDYVPDLAVQPSYTVNLEPNDWDGHELKALFRVTLFDTTSYPGCAMNAPNGTAPCRVRRRL